MSDPAPVTELPTDFDVHHCGIGDLLALRMLWEEFLRTAQPVYPAVFSEDVTAWTEQVALKLVQDPAQCTFQSWIAYEGLEPVGFLAGEVKFRTVGQPRVYAEIYWLFTQPGYRGRGIAPRLLRAGVEWLAANHIGVLELSAMPGDTQWIRRGWSPVSVQHVVGVETLAKKYLTRGGDRGRE